VLFPKDFFQLKKLEGGGGVIASDGREIVFAGAGILWGASTCYRGLRVWRAGNKLATDPSYQVHSVSNTRGALPTSLIAGFVLTLACTAYLAWSFLESLR
jgi:hypothetical protein